MLYVKVCTYCYIFQKTFLFFVYASAGVYYLHAVYVSFLQCVYYYAFYAQDRFPPICFGFYLSIMIHLYIYLSIHLSIYPLI